MAREILFVQFAHPGNEYVLTSAEKKIHIKRWNYDFHRRKFIQATGQIVKNNTLSPKQDLLFWGEWEPTSRVLANSTKVVIPKWIHFPFVEVEPNGIFKEWGPFTKKKGTISCGSSSPNTCSSGSCTSQTNPLPQNTDPFVFNEFFYYSCCKQDRFTRLKNLEKGSIILFGSSKKDQNGQFAFMLDTVFVVSDYRSYDSDHYANDLKGFIPQNYDQIMGFKYWPAKNNICYKGASVNNPINGMFSFVPCKPISGNEMGFSSIKLTNNDISILANYIRSVKYTFSDQDKNKKTWDKLCSIIHNQGFELGVNFEYKI